MHATEIKNKKRNLYLMLSGLMIVLLSIIYFAFFSGKFDDSNRMKIIYAGICLHLAFTIYLYGIKLLKDSDGNTHYMVVRTRDAKREINITWLDMQPDELVALIQSYKIQQ